MDDVTKISFNDIFSYINKYTRKRNKSLNTIKRLLVKINKCHQKMNDSSNSYKVTKDINEINKSLSEELSNLRTINHDLKYLQRRKAMLGISVSNNKHLELRDFVHGHILSYDDIKYPSRAQLHNFNTLYQKCQAEYVDNYPRDTCNNNTCTHYSNNWESTYISKNNDNLPYTTSSLGRYIHDEFTTGWYKVGFN